MTTPDTGPDLGTAPDTSPGYHDRKSEYLTRLRRVEGQVRGLQRMVEQDTYCIDILTQVSAVKSALQSVSVGLVEDHLGHCVQDAVTSAATSAAVGGVDGQEQARERVAEKITEASAAITRLLKS